MMLANIIVFGIIALCLLVIIFIIVRKFPQLSNIDVETIPEEKQGAVRDRLVRERFRRNFLEPLKSLSKKTGPAFSAASRGFSKTYSKVLEMERNYRKKLEPKTPKEKKEIDKKTENLVSQGEELLGKNNFAEAERKFIDAIALDPKDAEAYHGLGELYWEQGKMTEARETFEFLLKLNAENYEVYSHLGNIALAQGDLERARDYQLKSIELDSAAAVHYLDLARVYKESGKMDEAYESLQKAAGLEPNNPRNLDALLDLSIMMGKKKEAKEALIKLKEVNSENQKIEEFEEKIVKMK